MARSSYRRRLEQRRRLPTWRKSVDRDDIKVSSQPGVNTAAGLVGRTSAALLHFNQQASWRCADSQAGRTILAMQQREGSVSAHLSAFSAATISLYNVTWFGVIT